MKPTIIYIRDRPIKLDSEQKGNYVVRGNALLNIIGNSDTDKQNIRQIFEHNKNENFRKGIVIMVGDEDITESQFIAELIGEIIEVD